MNPTARMLIRSTLGALLLTGAIFGCATTGGDDPSDVGQGDTGQSDIAGFDGSLPDAPDAEPDAPHDADAPDADTEPDAPDADPPDADAPDADTEPDAPDDADAPDADAEPDAPDADAPDADAPDSDLGDTEPDTFEPECVAPADCGIDTDCLVYLCSDGLCGTSNVDSGTACGDGGSCDGDGACAPAVVLTLSPSESVLLEDRSDRVEFEVRADVAFVEDVLIGVSTSGSASPDDFVLSASEATLAAGTTSVRFTLTAAPDVIQEGDETVVVTILTDSVGVRVETASANVLIIDDEAPPLDSIDWLSQDVVVGDPMADPYCLPAERREAHITTALGYLRTDAAGDEGSVSALAPAYNPERQRWESRVLTTFDFRPYAESQPGVGGIPNGADVFEAEGQYVSIVGTNDSGGVAGWASSWGDGCQFFDGWISYDRTNIPDFDPENAASWASVSSPITGVSNPTRDTCPDGFGSTVTRWTFVEEFEFAADSTCAGDSGRKVMDTIVSDHDGGNHHEVFYFTDEYGSKSRWERWECGIPYPDHDYITDRCRYSEAQSAMHMAYGVDDDRRTIVNPNGDTCYMTDCRDFTTVQTIDAPGYKSAAWHYGAAIYFSGNILRNGDFHSDDEGWDSLGTTREMATAPDGNHYLRVSAAETGWHSVMGSSIDEFNRFFDADGAEALLPKYLHWGARIRLSEASAGSARLALVEWGNPGGEIIDERGLAPTEDWQWVEFHRLLGPATNSLDLRFRLDGMSGLEVDDVYVYISNEAER